MVHVAESQYELLVTYVFLVLSTFVEPTARVCVSVCLFFHLEIYEQKAAYGRKNRRREERNNLWLTLRGCIQLRVSGDLY